MLALHHAAMHLAPVARTLERTGPEPGAVLACGGLLRAIVAISHRPAGFHLAAVEIAPAGRAGGKQPVVLVALPAGARHRLAADQRRERVAGSTATGIIGSVAAAGLAIFRRIYAAQSDAFGSDRQ